MQFEYERHQPHLGKGFAYIEFTTPDEAETAMKNMDGGQIDGQVSFEDIHSFGIIFVVYGKP